MTTFVYCQECGNRWKVSLKSSSVRLIYVDREPRGASLAGKVTNFYACSSDLHTLSYVKVVVCRTHSGWYGQGGDEKIKLLWNSIAVIKKSIFIPWQEKWSVFSEKEDKTIYDF